MKIVRLGGLMPNDTEWQASRIQRDPLDGVVITLGPLLKTTLPPAEYRRLAKKKILIHLSNREAEDIASVVRKEV